MKLLATVEVWEWISNSIPYLIGYVIIHAGIKVSKRRLRDAATAVQASTNSYTHGYISCNVVHSSHLSTLSNNIHLNATSDSYPPWWAAVAPVDEQKYGE